MSDNHTCNTSGGIGVCGLLGVVFITLKLCNVIDWSWVWVTAPFWGSLALFLAVLAAVFVVALIAVMFGYGDKKH